MHLHGHHDIPSSTLCVTFQYVIMTCYISYNVLVVCQGPSGQPTGQQQNRGASHAPAWPPLLAAGLW